MSVEKNSTTDTILVAIDGSLPSQISARAAVQIAKNRRQNIRGLYVVGSRMILDGDRPFKTELNLESKPKVIDEAIDQFKTQGNKVLDWLEELCYGVEVAVTTDILFGGIPEVILEESSRVDLLAIGRRGHEYQNTPYVLGENFQSILSHQHVPMLIGGEEFTNFKRLHIVLSGNAEEKKLLSWGERLQKVFSSEVLISINREDENETDKNTSVLEQLEKSELVDYKQTAEPTHTGEDILTAASNYHADLILIEGYRRTTLGLRLGKNPLDDVLRHSEIMVLAV